MVRARVQCSVARMRWCLSGTRWAFQKFSLTHNASRATRQKDIHMYTQFSTRTSSSLLPTGLMFETNPDDTNIDPPDNTGGGGTTTPTTTPPPPEEEEPPPSGQ